MRHKKVTDQKSDVDANMWILRGDNVIRISLSIIGFRIIIYFSSSSFSSLLAAIQYRLVEDIESMGEKGGMDVNLWILGEIYMYMYQS